MIALHLSTPRKIIIGIIVLLGAITLIAAGLIYHKNNQYQQAYKENIGQAQQAISKAQKTLASSKQSDPNDAPSTLNITALENLQQSLQTSQQQIPETPHILNWDVSWQAQQSSNQNLHQILQDATKKLATVIELAHYQEDLSHFLKPLTKNQANSNQPQQSSQEWQQAQKNIQNIITPAASQNFHQQLNAQLKTITSQLSVLAKAEKDQDRTAFMEVQSQLDDDIQKLNKLKDEHQKIIQQADQDWQQAVQKIAELETK